MTDDQDLPMTEYRRAGLEITRGNPEVYKSLWSRRDDVTLANPFGPPVRGWQGVSDRLDLAASKYRDGQDLSPTTSRRSSRPSWRTRWRSNVSGRAWADPTS